MFDGLLYIIKFLTKIQLNFTVITFHLEKVSPDGPENTKNFVLNQTFISKIEIKTKIYQVYH